MTKMNDIARPCSSGLTPGDAAIIEAKAQLKLVEARNSDTPIAAATLQAEATGLQTLARQLRDAPTAGMPELILGLGGGLMPLPDPRMPVVMEEIAQAVHSPPDLLSGEASLSRLSLAKNAGVLTEAVEAAESVGAEGAVEQMLVHEMAAAHRVGMQLMAAASTALGLHERERIGQGSGHAMLEANRCALSAARLMDSVTRVAMALDRLRNGGRQQVTVQHLVVADGGQAVVAGSIGSGGRSGLGRARARGRGEP